MGKTVLYYGLIAMIFCVLSLVSILETVGRRSIAEGGNGAAEITASSVVETTIETDS